MYKSYDFSGGKMNVYIRGVDLSVLRRTLIELRFKLNVFSLFWRTSPIIETGLLKDIKVTCLD